MDYTQILSDINANIIDLQNSVDGWGHEVSDDLSVILNSLSDIQVLLDSFSTYFEYFKVGIIVLCVLSFLRFVRELIWK